MSPHVAIRLFVWVVGPCGHFLVFSLDLPWSFIIYHLMWLIPMWGLPDFCHTRLSSALGLRSGKIQWWISTKIKTRWWIFVWAMDQSQVVLIYPQWSLIRTCFAPSFGTCNFYYCLLLKEIVLYFYTSDLYRILKRKKKGNRFYECAFSHYSVRLIYSSKNHTVHSTSFIYF